MEPNQTEAYSRETAKLAVYDCKAMGERTDCSLPDFVETAAESMYGDPSKHNEITAVLCGLCRRMTPEQENRIIYDGRNPDARKLAEWWDNHKAVDAARAEDDEVEKALRVLEGGCILEGSGLKEDVDGDATDQAMAQAAAVLRKALGR